MRQALAAAMVLGLAACAGAPTRPEPPSTVTAAAPPPRASSGRRVSPYAPAQEDPNTRGHYTAGGLYRPGVADSTPDYVPDVDAIPEPEVVDLPRSAVGNRPTYTVLGKQYQVLDDHDGFVEQGLASYYGQKFHGRRTSNMEVYDMYAFTAAHKNLPLPSFARVTNLENGRSVVVRVNDRGPFHEGRVIDLSYAAAVKLDVVRRGTARVEVRALRPGEEDDAPVLAQAASPPPAAAPSAMDRLVASIPADTVASPAASVAATGAPSVQRFEMRAGQQTMSADEFDAWMKARDLRVATGRPATTTASPTTIATTTPPAATPPAVTAPTLPTAAPGVAGTPAGVTLQVASFSARDNADRALGLLRQAGIDGAQVLDGQSNGRPVWRLRVGPLAEAAVSELSARLVGLGFGPPQTVRE